MENHDKNNKLPKIMIGILLIITAGLTGCSSFEAPELDENCRITNKYANWLVSVPNQIACVCANVLEETAHDSIVSKRGGR